MAASNLFIPTSSDLFFTKHDSHDPRLGEWAQHAPHDFQETGISLLGYCDDEGIKNNGGRVGAHMAPHKIREYLYRMTPPQEKKLWLWDHGNLTSPALTLEKRHQVAQEKVKSILQLKNKLITLGGGHDYGFADGAGFIESFQGQKITVINFDAHLDVRPLDHGLTSGTPFYRLLKNYKGQFDFIEVGIQPQCNSPFHKQWALSQGTHLLELKEILQKGLWKSLQTLIDPQTQACFLSLDIDVFSQSVAPGASQSWPIGLDVNEFSLCLSSLLQNFNIPLLGIYEVSPPLDIDNRTSKLAAQIAHQYIFST